jgi:CheY-like chemotaxis protein
MVQGTDSKPTVLCIDDNAVALAIRRDAQDALQTFKSRPIDLVLSDHCLKDTTGVEIARQMKQFKPTVPVVLYSGAPPETMGPVDCFILKTEPPDYLLNCLRDLVERSHN